MHMKSCNHSWLRFYMSIILNHRLKYTRQMPSLIQVFCSVVTPFLIYIINIIIRYICLGKQRIMKYWCCFKLWYGLMKSTINTVDMYIFSVCMMQILILFYSYIDILFLFVERGSSDGTDCEVSKCVFSSGQMHFSIIHFLVFLFRMGLLLHCFFSIRNY